MSYRVDLLRGGVREVALVGLAADANYPEAVLAALSALRPGTRACVTNLGSGRCRAFGPGDAEQLLPRVRAIVARRERRRAARDRRTRVRDAIGDYMRRRAGS